jgi:hypothetical protein
MKSWIEYGNDWIRGLTKLDLNLILRDALREREERVSEGACVQGCLGPASRDLR